MRGRSHLGAADPQRPLLGRADSRPLRPPSRGRRHRRARPVEPPRARLRRGSPCNVRACVAVTPEVGCTAAWTNAVLASVTATLQRHGRPPAPRRPRVGPWPVRDLPRLAVPARALRHLRSAVPRSALQPRRRTPVHRRRRTSLRPPGQDRSGRRPRRSTDGADRDHRRAQGDTPMVAMASPLRHRQEGGPTVRHRPPATP